MPEEYLEMLDDCVRADRWRRSIESGQGQVLMALVNDEVVGFAAFLASRDGDSNPGCGEVSAIYLLPEVWSRGAGRALMDAALVALADAGFTEVVAVDRDSHHGGHDRRPNAQRTFRDRCRHARRGAARPRWLR
ncbi:MAG: GNAT family N-acetyltransferase [Acidimicrobiia bacterium]|nr:GNAT family N-acetyltransferase [Acidimicrobiia bacterium]